MSTVETNYKQVLRRICRQDSGENLEKYRACSPGARTAAQVIKVISLSSYNVYNVRTVQIGAAGSTPVLVGTQTTAVNVAEDFLQEGLLPANTYAIMFRVGDKNVFYVPI